MAYTGFGRKMNMNKLRERQDSLAYFASGMQALAETQGTHFIEQHIIKPLTLCAKRELIDSARYEMQKAEKKGIKEYE